MRYLTKKIPDVLPGIFCARGLCRLRRHARDTGAATRTRRHGRGDTDAGVYAASAATRPPNLFRRSAATFCRIVFYDLAAARRYTLGGRVDT